MIAQRRKLALLETQPPQRRGENLDRSIGVEEIVPIPDEEGAVLRRDDPQVETAISAQECSVAVEKVTQRRVVDHLAFISPRLSFATRRMKDVEDSQRLGEMCGQAPEHGGIAARHA